MPRLSLHLAAIAAALALAACSDDNNDDQGGADAAIDPDASTPDAGATDTGTDADPPPASDTYAFASRFEDSSSVSYAGQTKRHMLIEEIKLYIDGLEELVQGDAFNPISADEISEQLVLRYEADEALGADDLLIKTDPPAAQTGYDFIGSSSLKQKMAGNDASTDYKDWDDQSSFQGWSDASFSPTAAVGTPEELLLSFYRAIGEQAYALEDAGELPKDPISGANLPVYVSPTGLDYKQLSQKFALMAIAFAQAADDYLDDDAATPEKGLLLDNTRVTKDGDEKAYSALEHVWDEGFGYFGAARDYLDYTDAEIASGDPKDSDEDGAIDLGAEYNWGASVNAAKRDLGSTDPETDLTDRAYRAFLAGRRIITEAPEELDAATRARLIEQRDIALGAWEEAIAATVIHYINDTLEEMEKIDLDQNTGYSLAEHAKVWSEMKGFALGFQFNPRSPLVVGDKFAELHELMGDAPTTSSATQTELDEAKNDLNTARDILRDAYQLSDANVQAW